MPCYQCSRPAMYQVGEQNIPLCLECFSKYSQIQQVEVENNERMINHALDQMDAVTGIRLNNGRFPPRPAPVVISGVKMHNINLSNSVVGTINTGTIGSVDQSISALIQTGEPDLANAVKELSEAILRSADLTLNQRNELIETLSFISAEAATPKDRRRGVVARTLLESAAKITGLANDLCEIGQRCWPLLYAAFPAA